MQEIDTFNVQSAESLIEVTFNGRLDVDSMTGNAVRFELRGDETGNDGGIHATMTGIFTGLSPGTHTLSLWAQVTNSGTATGVRADPGCFGADHAVVKEYLPFGTIALPLIITD